MMCARKEVLQKEAGEGSAEWFWGADSGSTFQRPSLV